MSSEQAHSVHCIDMFVNAIEGHIGAIHNRHPESPNKHPAYEYNINYGEKDVEAINLVEKVELPS